MTGRSPYIVDVNGSPDEATRERVRQDATRGATTLGGNDTTNLFGQLADLLPRTKGPALHLMLMNGFVPEAKKSEFDAHYRANKGAIDAYAGMISASRLSDAVTADASGAASADVVLGAVLGIGSAFIFRKVLKR